jgi:outer membrane protein OmpA-like peptidoglycan-associated protein
MLSENRAKSVYEFLVQNGVKTERLTYKGYGESMPILDNETEVGRQKNRRTEFKVLTN